MEGAIVRNRYPKLLILRNSKFVFRDFKSGYTLIEVVVVMSIMAALAILGVGTWTSIRNSQMVDSTAEELVSTIRESQNNAIAVKPGTCVPSPPSTTSSTKVWGVEVTGNNYSIINRCYTGNTQDDYHYDSSNLSPYPDVQILDSSNNPIDTRVWFSTPFGKGEIPDPGTFWGFQEDTTDPAEEYIPIPPATGRASAPYNIILKRGNYLRTVVVEPNGDVYEQ